MADQQIEIEEIKINQDFNENDEGITHDQLQQSQEHQQQLSSLRNVLMGSLCVALATFFYSTNDVLVKLSELPESQLVIGRFGLQLIMATIWWNLQQPPDTTHWYGDAPHIKNIWLRGILAGTATACIWYSIIRLPLGDAVCLFYQSPFIIAIMARFILKEQLPNSFPLIVICAIIGVLFITQPTFILSLGKQYGLETAEAEPLNVDGLIAMVICVMFYSATPILIRKALKAHWLQLEMAMSTQMLGIILPVAVFFNHFIFDNKFIGDWKDWKFDGWAILYIVLISVNGFAAVSLKIIGYQYGDATKVSWLEYTSLIGSVLCQYYVFKDAPNMFEIIGVVFVCMATGLNVMGDLWSYYQIKKEYEPVNVMSSGNETDITDLDSGDRSDFSDDRHSDHELEPGRQQQQDVDMILI